MSFVLITIALSVVTCVLLVGCSSSGTDSNGEQVDSQSTESGTTDAGTGSETTNGSVTADFDGTWRTDCFENTVFGLPEDSQPDGYVQRSLTIDSTASARSETRQIYTDAQCTIEDPDEPAVGGSGDILFEGVVTTSTGLEATVVRYVGNGSNPDLIGLLYREDNVLFRELRQSTAIIEDEVPTNLSLSVPWRLVD